MIKLRYLLFFVAVVVLSTACNPYRIAWITGSGVRNAAFQTEHVLAERAKTTNTECLKTTKPKTPEYEVCVRKILDANVQWIKYYRPAINSSLTIFVTSLSLAEASKDKKLPWLEYLMPSLCALSEVYVQWNDLLKDPGLKVLLDGLFKYLNTASCKKVVVTP